jgi:nuclear migration protein JNM1
LSHRLRALQLELTSLEAELADPSNPQLHKERKEDHVDPGELIRGLVDVRGRLDRIRKEKEGRAKLVGAVLADDTSRSQDGQKTVSAPRKGQDMSIGDMDHRIGELEKLIGSSTAPLDEVTFLLTRTHEVITML